MLALSDNALARLVIAASAVPRRKRSAWLTDLAELVEVKKRHPRTAKNRENSKRHYRRQASPNPERVYSVAVRDLDLIALSEKRILTEDDLADPDAIQKALARLIHDIVQK